MAAPQRQLLSCCDCLLAPRRVLEQLQPRPDTQEVHGMAPLEAALAWLTRRHQQGKRCVVLTSGDPLWFGLGRALLQRFSPEDLAFSPAATSMQQLFARLKRPWQDVTWVSLHGRDADRLVAALPAPPQRPGGADGSMPGRAGGRGGRPPFQPDDRLLRPLAGGTSGASHGAPAPSAARCTAHGRGPPQSAWCCCAAPSPVLRRCPGLAWTTVSGASTRIIRAS